MSETESPVIIPFRPLDILKEKPEPLQYERIYEFTPSSASTEGTTISNILVNDLDENNVDRTTILERLQINGFLVKPCKDKSIDTIDTVETIQPISSKTEESPQSVLSPEAIEEQIPLEDTQAKSRKIKDSHIQLDQHVDESVSKTAAVVAMESSLEKVDLPRETNFSFSDVESQLEINKNIVFILCSSKEEEKAPGKEPSEKISKENARDFAVLEKIPKWRQQLCNSFDKPFTLDSKTWQNVDHFLIAAQYRQYSSENAFDQYVQAINIHATKKLGSKKIKVDTDYPERERQEMFHALYAKFTQNPELARILDATRDAQLFYRVNKQKKIEFIELMWLRQILREYVQKTLKPLSGEVEPIESPTKKDMKKTLEKEYDLSEISLSQYATQLPQYKADVVKASSYYLNNRTQFIQKMNEVFRKYSENKGDQTQNAASFDLLSHQKVVRDYLDIVTPYRGLLVYHNLGTGKSCTSIAVTEGMKNSKRIVIMVPASLKRNYEYELQKCGDLMYRDQQYWEFVSADGKPDLIPLLAKALSMDPRQVRENKGAWMVDVNKPSNFKNLSPQEQSTVRTQISHMIHQKYSFLHYNANNLGTKVNEMKKISKNPFDHTTIVIDEAHNFISNIVGNLKKKQKDSVYMKIYDLLMDATDLKVVMLSGTPIINYPQEIAVLFNILRGYIYTWTFKLKINTKEKVNTEYIRKILDKHKCVTYDFVEYTRNTLTITRNPYGFVNVNEDRKRGHVTKKAHHIHGPEKQTRRQNGGYGEYGVTLHETGNISNDDFKKQIIHILKKNEIETDGSPKMVKEKCIPDDEKTFQTMFINASTDFQDKTNNTTDIMHIQTLKRRILGLTSYFRSPNEALLPSFVMNEKGTPIHEVVIPMSDYQFADYAKVRKVELEKEKKQKKIKNLQKAMDNQELFQMASTYRVFSRTLCNFAFPTPPGRPFPKLKQGQDEVEEDDVESASSKPEVQGMKKDRNVDDGDGYEKQIESAMTFLRENREKLLSPSSLAQYSPKMLEILKNIQKKDHEGLHLVYSNFVTMEGIGIFQEVLNANGFQEFKIKKQGGQWVLDYKHDGSQCYALYTGNEEPEVREIVRNVFNGDWDNVPDTITLELRKQSPNNMYGEIIKVFMITAAGAEGINLKNTRYVHIMEPYWHNVRLEQVIGRARRINSHITLPKELQTVEVFLYLSVMSESHKTNENFKEIQVNDLSKLRENTPVTTDEYLYEIAQMKQKINGQFLRIIKETAMDCHLYIQKHKKYEPLVCYGRAFPPDRKFVSYPSIKMDLQEDTNKPAVHVSENK